MNDPVGDHGSGLFNPVNYVLREVTRVSYKLVTNFLCCYILANKLFHEGLIQTFIKKRK